MNPFLAPLAAGFRLGVALRSTAHRHGWLKTRRLTAPVISIGNLTVGGTGKTPLVQLVASILLRKGIKPAILTRGYGRRNKADVIVVPPEPERRADAREIGDEPALLARALPEVPIIICADRFRGGTVAEQRFHVDVHVLDDGFQHLALARDLDIVAFDVSTPPSDLALLPAGRAREPLAALARAQCIVFTRTASGDLSKWNELIGRNSLGLEYFHASTELVGITDVASGAAVSVDSLRRKRLLAFCGIANPVAFFQDAKRWGLDLVAEHAFPDHHVYTEKDLGKLVAEARQQAATALLTTEKDAVKLAAAGGWELPVLAGGIAFRVLEAEKFERTLFTHLGRVQGSRA